MKNNILIFIIGFLVGAIIATGGFLIYGKTKSENNRSPEKNMPQMMERNGDRKNMQNPPQMPEGEEPPQMLNDFNEKKSRKSNDTGNEENTNTMIKNKINQEVETNM